MTVQESHGHMRVPEESSSVARMRWAGRSLLVPMNRQVEVDRSRCPVNDAGGRTISKSYARSSKGRLRRLGTVIDGLCAIVRGRCGMCAMSGPLNPDGKCRRRKFQGVGA